MWGGLGGPAGGMQRECYSVLIAFTSLLQRWVNITLFAERSQWRTEAMTTERKDHLSLEQKMQAQVGKEKGRESAQCQNLGEKLSISWQVPPKHLLPCLEDLLV